MSVYNKRFLEAASAYNFDTASAKTVGIGNEAMQQDVLSLRLKEILGSLSSESRKGEDSERQRQFFIMLIAVVGILVVAILWITK